MGKGLFAVLLFIIITLGEVGAQTIIRGDNCNSYLNFVKQEVGSNSQLKLFNSNSELPRFGIKKLGFSSYLDEELPESMEFMAGGSTPVVGTSLVSALQLWLRADVGTSSVTDGARIRQWSDQKGSNNGVSLWGIRRDPFYEINEANFNPSIRFGGGVFDDYLEINRPVNEDFTFVIVVRPNMAGGTGANWYNGAGIIDGEVAGSSNDFGGLTLVGDKLAFGTSGVNSIADDHTLISRNPIFANGIPHIAIATRVKDTGQKSLFIDGITDNTGIGIRESFDRPDKMRIGSLQSGTNYYNGYIFEILVYNKALTTIEREHVESYLALKYGLTIGKNYVASVGSIYNVAGYGNDIAGIGVDAVFDLNQKVASSVNVAATTGGNTTIATTNNFTDTNQATSRTELGVDQFLVWGHNNGAITSYQTIGDYVKVPRTWQVENTGNVGEVNFQINLSGFPAASSTGFYYILIDNDDDFSNGILESKKLTNSSGSLYDAVVGFQNGTSYFSIGYATAQPAFWVKADNGTSTTIDNARINSWNDQSGNDNNAQQITLGNQPTYQENEANFNPVVLFDGSNDFYDLTTTAGLGYGSEPRETFVVARDNGTASTTWEWAFAYGKSSRRQAWAIGARISTGRNLALSSYDGDIVLSGSNPYWGNNYRLITGEYDGASMRLFAEGTPRFTRTSGLSTTVSRARIGRQVNGGREYWGGEIAEIMHVLGDVTPEKRSEIETYLAIKYGITKTTNYQVGTSTIYSIFRYENDIAGIGNNSEYGLNQKVSSSVNTSPTTASNVVMATTNDFTSANNDAGRTTLNNGQYLIWGHNGASTASWVDDGNYKRVSRFWKAENTGNVGNVFFQINTTGYPTAITDYYLVVDSDNNLSNGVTEKYLLTGTGNLFSGQVNFSAGVNYFTIATFEELNIELISYSNISRNGLTNGALTIEATGGEGTYTYSWSNGESTPAISGLGAGVYTITVNSGMYNAQKSFYLHDPDALSVTSSVTTTPNCPNDETGVIELDVNLPNEKSIRFDGVDDYIALNKSFTGTNAIEELTVCAWVKVPPGKGGWSIIDFGESEYFNVSIGDRHGVDNNVQFNTHSALDGNSTKNLEGNAIVANNNWHHIACVYDGKKKFIYVDGALDNDSDAHNGKALGSAETRFGFIGDGSEATSFDGTRNGYYFEGQIAMVEMWDRAMVKQEVEARMKSTAVAAGLTGQWLLEEGAGSTITGVAGGNGQLIGGATWETDSFYSVDSYTWTKAGDIGFSESTKDLNSLKEGTYNCTLQIINGYVINLSEILDAPYENISTNPIQME